MLEQTKGISFRISSVLCKVEPEPVLYSGSGSDQKVPAPISSGSTTLLPTTLSSITLCCYNLIIYYFRLLQVYNLILYYSFLLQPCPLFLMLLQPHPHFTQLDRRHETGDRRCETRDMRKIDMRQKT